MFAKIILILVVALSFAHSAIAKEGKRFALLVGNSAYNDAVGKLTNPGNDITIIGNTLARLGFEVVKVNNASLGRLYRELSAHTRRVRRAGADAVSFFYYSGHGAQDPDTSTNYLIPVDVSSTLDSDLWDRSLRLSVITRQLKEQAGNATHFVVFDACRNALKVRKAGAKSATASKGFVPIPKVTGMLVAYATAQGETASDVGDGAGPYARALAAELSKPGIEAVTMFRNVQVRVFEQIRQEPWLDFGYLSRIYLAGNQASEPESDGVSPSIAKSEASTAWAAVERSRDCGIVRAFAEQYPGTVWARFAASRLRTLQCTELNNRASSQTDKVLNYAEVSFGFNRCKVKWGKPIENTQLSEMVERARAKGAPGFTYHPELKYGYLMEGEYPSGCKSPKNQSWPLFLLKR